MALHVTEGAGSPVGSVIPTHISQHYTDTLTKSTFISTGLNNTDWKEIGEGSKMTDLEVKTAYENNLDTNVFDDVAQLKLSELIVGEADSVDEWQPSTNYVEAQVVWESLEFYKAVGPHTSGLTFAGDSAHWTWMSTPLDPSKVAKTGDTMTGQLVMSNTSIDIGASPDNTDTTRGTFWSGAHRIFHSFTWGDNGVVTPDGENLFIGDNCGNTTLGETATQTYHASQNIGIGTTALTSLTTGYKNFGFGSDTLKNVTSGYENIGIGDEALTGTTTGKTNIAIGRKVMEFNVDGSFNIGIGGQSLFNNLTASTNVGIGIQSLYNNTASGNNIAIGYKSGFSTTGASNISIGRDAASNNTSGANNITIGTSQPVINPTSDYQLNIGGLIRGNMTSGSEEVVLPLTKVTALEIGGIVSEPFTTADKAEIDANIAIKEDSLEPTGFIRDEVITMGILELSPDGNLIHRIDQNGVHSTTLSTHPNYDPTLVAGEFYGGTIASAREVAFTPISGQVIEVYIGGTKNTLTTQQTVTLADSSGIRFVYMNSSAVLSASQTFDYKYFRSQPIVSLIYGNPTTQDLVSFADERHGITMDGFTHQYLHLTEGARYYNGMDIAGLVGGGTTHGAVGEGNLYDEDILQLCPSQTDLPFLYMEGQTWNLKPDSDLLGYTVTGDTYVSYNQNITGTYQLTEITSNGYCTIMYIVATNDSVYPYIKLVGQHEYTSANNARDAIFDELNEITTIGLPSPEFVMVGAIIIDRSGTLQLLTDGSTYLDLRNIKTGGTGGTSQTIVDHRNTTNRDAVDQHPISAITNLQTELDGKAPVGDIILTSPDLTEYRLLVDNSGVLSTELVV